MAPYFLNPECIHLANVKEVAIHTLQRRSDNALVCEITRASVFVVCARGHHRKRAARRKLLTPTVMHKQWQYIGRAAQMDCASLCHLIGEVQMPNTWQRISKTRVVVSMVNQGLARASMPHGSDERNGVLMVIKVQNIRRLQSLSQQKQRPAFFPQGELRQHNQGYILELFKQPIEAIRCLAVEPEHIRQNDCWEGHSPHHVQDYT